MEDELVFGDDGEFLGWWVTVEERWETVQLVGGGSRQVKTNDYSRTFIARRQDGS